MKKYAYNLRLFILFILTVLTIALPTGCEEDTAPDKPGEVPVEGVTKLEAIIGPAGGTVGITDIESLIYRAGVYVQPDALSEEIPISISFVENHESWNSEIAMAGEVISFEPDGIMFDKPVELFLPYKDEDNDGFVDGTGVSEENVRVMFFNPETNLWKDVPIKDINPENNTVSIETEHFSVYTAVSYLTKACQEYEGLTCGPYYFTLYYDFRHGTDSFRASVSDVGVDLNAHNASITDESNAVLEDEGFKDLFNTVIDATSWTWTWQIDSQMTFLTRSLELEDDEVEVEILATAPTFFEFTWNFDYTQMSPGEMLVVKFSGATDSLCQLLDRSPVAPQNITADNITDNSITISWDEIVYLYDDFTYNLYLSDDGGSTFSLLSNISDTSYNVSGLDSGTTYFLKVTTAYDSGMESADSQTVSAATL